MSAMYETNFTLSLDTAEREARVEIRNPSASPMHLHVSRIGITSEAEFAVFTLTRYDSLATHGTGGDAPTQETVRAWEPEAPAPSFEIWSGEPGVALIWPGSGVDYLHDFQLDPSDAGDDDKIQFNQYLTEDHTVVIEPGTSASLTFPAGQAEFIVKILVREMPQQPIEVIASSTLPAAGAYTSATLIDVPEEWEAVCFRGTYTAAGGSTNARPKARIMWSDGVTTTQHTIVDEALDVSGAPVAFQNMYLHEFRWPSSVTASSSVSFDIAAVIPAGKTRARLDVAEFGDTANPGTIVVTITGK